MKKVIALLLAVLYLVFTLFTLLQVSDEEGRFGQMAQALSAPTDTTTDEQRNAVQNDITDEKSRSNVPNHTKVTGKRALPRPSCVVRANKNIFFILTNGYQKPKISNPVVPLLYYSSTYLRNGVLRI